jgi:hypothetical protein
MVIAGRNFTTEILSRLRESIESGAAKTRGAVARLLCELFDWRDGNGRPKQTSARILLNEMERRGIIELPAPREVNFAARTPLVEETPREWAQIETTLSKLDDVELVVVKGNKALSREWRAMMREHHPLSDGPLCGAQLRYVIRCKQGLVGGMSFSAPAQRLKARDRWIGWSEGTRKQRLGLVVGNTRFLILPSVQVKNLASHVLSLASEQLVEDWHKRYGVRPVLLETFVDTSRYAGTCYDAANWIDVGTTQGRGRQDRNREATLAPKRVLVYPLRRDCRKLLAAPLVLPRIVLSASDDPPVDWADEEFGRCQLSEPLRERLLQIARRFACRPLARIPQAFEGDVAACRATYRFFAHRDTTIETLLQSHYAATEKRVGEMTGQVVLAVQDTTSLNYGNLGSVLGLGPIGNDVRSQGLYLHSTLAITPQGLPLGFLDAQCWARDAEQFGTRKDRWPIEEKESYRWIKSYQAVAALQQRLPDVTVVSVGDREADIYELFHEAAKDPRGPHLLIRAQHDRALEDEGKFLFGAVQSQPIAGYVHLQLPRQQQRAPREAKLAIRCATLRLTPPQSKPNLPVIEVQAIYASEEQAPPGEEPIEWRLLTTLPVTTFEQAAEKVSWYAQRWGIEVFHRTLKSGCRIEDRQLRNADRLEACLAIDMVVAWRICYLVKLGREVPEAPCTVYFSDSEWKALCAYRNKNPIAPDEPPTLREAQRMVAKLGGFLGRKSDGEPGTEVMWRGLQALDLITETWLVMTGGP